MKVNFNDIPDSGMSISGDIDQTLIDARDDDNFHFIAPLKVEARLEKIEDTVIATTKTQSKYAGTCSRCLEEVEQEWAKNFVLDLNFESNVSSIELDEEVRQEVILNFPSRVLCKDDCKGICMDCGVNLNKDACKCTKS